MVSRKYRKFIIILGISIFLWVVSLWQIELVMIWLRAGKNTFEFPFLLFQTNIWIARDIWYTVNAISFLIPVLYIIRGKGELID